MSAEAYEKYQASDYADDNTWETRKTNRTIIASNSATFIPFQSFTNNAQILTGISSTANVLLYYFQRKNPQPFSSNKTVLANLRRAVSRGFAPVVLFNESLACNLTEVLEIDSKEAW